MISPNNDLILLLRLPPGMKVRVQRTSTVGVVIRHDFIKQADSKVFGPGLNVPMTLIRVTGQSAGIEIHYLTRMISPYEESK